MKFFKDYFLALVTSFFASFYGAYFLTVNYQIFSIHKKLIQTRAADSINFGIITFVIFALLPILLLRMTSNSEIPLLVKTYRARMFLSYIIIAYTISLFSSKIIYNSIATDVMSWETDLIFDKIIKKLLGVNGRVTFVEIFSLGIPFVLFLWLSKKIIDFLNKDDNENDTFHV